MVDGVQRIEPDTVRSYLLVQEGDIVDPSRIDRSLKSLYATGLFDDVEIRLDGNRLIVTVVENPVINRIAFEGNERIDDETLQSEVTLRPRVIYTRVKVANDVERVLNIYRRTGRFGATVEPRSFAWHKTGSIWSSRSARATIRKSPVFGSSATGPTAIPGCARWSAPRRPAGIDSSPATTRTIRNV